MIKKHLIHISHNDLDGYSCQYITNNIDFISKQYYNINYNEILPTLNQVFAYMLKNKEKEFLFLITDISMKSDSLKKITNFLKGNKHLKIDTKIIDHHIDTKLLDESPIVFASIDYCSTKLTYLIYKNYVKNKEKMKEFSDIVNAYDLWLEKNEYFITSKFLNNIIFSFIKYPDQLKSEKRNHIFKYINKFLKRLNENESLTKIQDKLFKDNRKIALNSINKKTNNKNMVYEEIMFFIYFNKLKPIIKNEFELINFNYKDNKYNLYICYNWDSNVFQNVSHYMLNNKLCNLVINLKENKTLSFRSKDKINCQIIAKDFFNGGGHKNASGAYFDKMPEIHSQIECENIIKKELNI